MYKESIMSDLGDLILAAIKRQDTQLAKQDKPDKPIKAQKQSKQNAKPDRKLRPVMTRDEILQVIAKIQIDDSVEIQFKGADLNAVNYLQGMHYSGMLTVGSADQAMMVVVTLTHQWGDQLNRIFTFEASHNWDPNWFKTRLTDALESITIL